LNSQAANASRRIAFAQEQRQKIATRKHQASSIKHQAEARAMNNKGGRWLVKVNRVICVAEVKYIISSNISSPTY
jgi:hypothetical protein